MSLTVTRNYSALNVLTESQLDAAFDSIEAKFNSTLIAGSEMQTSTIEAGNLAANAVTTAKILDSNVTTGKLADGAVTGIKRLVTTSATKTTTYTATTADEFIPVTTASAWTLTMYAVASNAGRRVVVQKTSSDLNALTINDSAAAAITTINTQGETVELLTDGTSWYVTRRYIPCTPVSFTPTGTWIANTTYTGSWVRHGIFAEIRVGIALAGAPTSATLTVNMPTGLVIDSAKLFVSSSESNSVVGSGHARDVGSGSYPLTVMYPNDASKLQPFAHDTGGTFAARSSVTQAAPCTFGNTDGIEFTVLVPIVGWNG